MASASWGANAFSGFSSGILDCKNQLRLRNTTANSTILLGEGQKVFEVLSVINGSNMRVCNTLQLKGIVTISSTANIELQHYIDSTSYGSGPTGYDAGTPFSTGDNEVYSSIVIEKIN